MSHEQTAYELLGVPESATPDEIRQARKRLAKGELNPNTTADPEERVWREERLKQVNAAVDRLTDLEKRKAYDDELARDREVAADESTPDGYDHAAPVEAVDPREHSTEPAILPALGNLLWRLIRAGARQLPWIFRNAPRLVLIGGGLLLAVIVSSWVFRSCASFNDEVRFEGSLPDPLTRNCQGGFGFGGHVPEGSSAALDCVVKGVPVKYFDTDDGSADRYFARHLHRASRRAVIRKGKTGSCARPGHVTAYRYRGDYGPAGRVFCWITKHRQVRFEWTDGNIYAQAVSGRPYAFVYQWWRKHAGPLADNRGVGVQTKVR